MLLEIMSPTEVVVAVSTDNGDFDVLLEIRHDDLAGFWYSSMYYTPQTNNRIRKSSFPVSLQIELSELVDKEFRQYVNHNEHSILQHLTAMRVA